MRRKREHHNYLLLVFLILSLIAGLVWMNSARAQMPRCADHDTVKETLRADFNEVIVAVGTMDNGRLIELFKSNESWTLVITNGERACIMAAGESWQTVPRLGLEL